VAIVRDDERLLELTAGAGTARQAEHPWRRRLIWIAAVVAVIAVGIALFPGGFPDGLVYDAAKPLNTANDWVTVHQRTNAVFVHVLVPFKNAINSTVDQLTKGLARLTWLGLLALIAALAGYVAGWRKAVLAGIGFGVIAILGFWADSLPTLSLILVSVMVALAIGIPVGILCARHPLLEKMLRPVLDAMQTVPAFSYIIIFILLFSGGATTAMLATVVFALPPAIRLTSLGIRQVPEDALEAGLAFGVTKRQLLRKVQLPLAKPAIMVGVNQTIMMALGIIVIAATVGYPGLGLKVLDALQGLHVGQALAAGLALVAMAIVLDRVTFGWSEAERQRRGSTSVHIFGWTISRKALLVVLGVVVVLAVIVGRQVLRQQDFPDTYVVSIAPPVDRVDQSVIHSIGQYTRSLSDVTTTRILTPLTNLLTAMPWWMVCLGAAAAAYAAARRWTLALMAFVCIAVIGFVGQWDNAMDTLAQVILAVVISVAIAIPVGIWSSRSDRVQRMLKPLLDGMQTLPQFVYLVPVIALFHVGRIPGIIAALIYALPPCIRLTDLGIRQVPHDRVEAAVAFGADKKQLLRKVQLPLAKPSIMLGVNQTIMMVLSVVIIAGLVGGEGLGYQVINGLSHDFGTAMIAGFCILLLAIVIDRITQAMGQPGGRPTGGPNPIGWFFGTSRARRAAVEVGRDEIPGAIPAGKGEV
jgi:glycine betaine/proline transport system permease protein